jgi:hypothetical protein
METKVWQIGRQIALAGMKGRCLFVVDLLRVEKVKVKVVVVVVVMAFLHSSLWSAQSGVKPEAVSLCARTGGWAIRQSGLHKKSSRSSTKRGTCG